MWLTDDVISLRPITVADARVHLAGEDSELVRWVSGSASTLDEVIAHFQRCEQAWARQGPARTFAITERADDILVGTLDVRTGLEFLAAGQADLAYGLHPDRRGRGLATRAVVLGCRFLARAGLAEEAVLRIDPANAASVAVARRAGFHYFRSTDEPGQGRLDWYYQAV
ncbi:GNAT family N-acetyltransferase [Nocardia sp. NPDC005366]|uniref:GNAT family N-acetyltransferase n=1 Tax=Nocardia sp. NPDC005366 TaxID=3156878 RepID=UPI0033A62164